MNCPKCGSINYCKDGIAQGRQRYQCKGCHYRYTVEKKSDVKSVETRKMALELYLEGLGFRAIGRVLKVSYVTVFYWIKEWGEKVKLPKREESIEIVELDEIHSYVSQKKTTAGHGLLLIDLENGLSLLSVETAPRRQD
jgi:transposase-like protein